MLQKLNLLTLLLALIIAKVLVLMVGTLWFKNTFKVGDKCVYFEIDSKLDTTQPMFEFLKNAKVKD